MNSQSDRLPSHHKIAETDAEKAGLLPQPAAASSTEKYPGFMRLKDLDSGRKEYQVFGLVPRTGVLLVVAPPGPAHAAFINYLASLLVGRIHEPFGDAAFPGDVLLMSHTLTDGESLSSNKPYERRAQGELFVYPSERSFNWRIPTKSLDAAFQNAKPGNIAGVIIDAGPVASSLSSEIVASAEAELRRMAKDAHCIIILVVEAGQTGKDPFLRIPKPLRGLRDSILICPLTSKGRNQASLHGTDYLLLQMSHESSNPRFAKFSLYPELTFPQRTGISWGERGFGDPRETLAMADRADLRGAYKKAAEFAREYILHRGSATSQELQIVGLTVQIAKTTMRDALSIAYDCRYLTRSRTPAGTTVWTIPYGLPYHGDGTLPNTY